MGFVRVDTDADAARRLLGSQRLKNPLAQSSFGMEHRLLAIYLVLGEITRGGV